MRKQPILLAVAAALALVAGSWAWLAPTASAEDAPSSGISIDMWCVAGWATVEATIDVYPEQGTISWTGTIDGRQFGDAVPVVSYPDGTGGRTIRHQYGWRIQALVQQLEIQAVVLDAATGQAAEPVSTKFDDAALKACLGGRSEPAPEPPNPLEQDAAGDRNGW